MLAFKHPRLKIIIRPRGGRAFQISAERGRRWSGGKVKWFHGVGVMYKDGVRKNHTYHWFEYGNSRGGQWYADETLAHV